MPAITLTIGVATCAKCIIEYLGIIESATKNTNRLRHAPLNSAIEWFNNAKNCKDSSIMKDYLNDARKGFMDAISLEDDENKIAAIVGLSMCQYLLGDKTNASLNMQKVKDVELSTGAIMRASAKYLPLPMFISQALIAKAVRDRREAFDTYKTKALTFNNKVLVLPH